MTKRDYTPTGEADSVTKEIISAYGLLSGEEKEKLDTALDYLIEGVRNEARMNGHGYQQFGRAGALELAGKLFLGGYLDKRVPVIPSPKRREMRVTDCVGCGEILSDGRVICDECAKVGRVRR